MGLYDSELELLKALEARQSEALVYLYDLYGKPMYSLALKILNDAQEAEDLIQEILVGLWKQCRFDPQRGSLKTYLFLLVRSRALDRLRVAKSSHRIALEHQQLPSDRILPLDQIITQEKVDRVKAAIATLPESQRQAIELAYYEGLTQPEIAQRLVVPLGTVKSWFRLGFKKLRAALNEEHSI